MLVKVRKSDRFPYIDPPRKHKPPFLNSDLNLQDMLDESSKELSLQQSKRDQLIGFYLTGAGLVSAGVFSLEMNNTLRMWILVALFIIGLIWSIIAIRYKIYKEAYWMCCKTILSLFSADRDKIDKPTVQHLFFKVVKKCYKSVPKKKNGKPSLWAFICKNLTSAEYLMFSTLMLLSALAGSAALYLLLNGKFPQLGWINGVITGIAFVVYAVLQTVNYNIAALSVFKVAQDETNKSFNSIYEKAWFLHLFGYKRQKDDYKL